MSIPAIVFWLLAAVVLFSPTVCAVYLFLCTAAFGALALLSADATSGANVLPQSMAAIILAVKVFLDARHRRIALKAVTDLRGYGLECAFVALAVVSAIALPRVFDGHVFVVTLKMTLTGAEPLEPTMGNLAQAVYLTLNLLAGLALFTYIAADEKGERRDHVMLALLASGGILALSGIMDELSQFVPGIRDVVVSFKTATYSFFLDNYVHGVRRISGFFSEASAFAGPSVAMGALLYYIRPAFRNDMVRTIICPLVSFLLIVLTAVSTSTTAYAGLGVFALTVVWRIGYRYYKTRTIKGLELDLAIAGVLGIAFIGILALAPDITHTPMAILESMVFHKQHSSSFSQRNYWNTVAMQAFLDTYGIGVGPGGARASDWLVALLSNTGVLGFALMAGFIVVSFMQKPTDSSRRSGQLMTGAKYAFVIFLATEVASGTTVDPGFLLATLIALMVGPSARAASYIARQKGRGARSRRRSTGSRAAASAE